MSKHPDGVEKLQDLNDVLVAMEVGDQTNWMGDYHFLRVPGGWVVTMLYGLYGQTRVPTTTFVPEPPTYFSGEIKSTGDIVPPLNQ